MLLARNVATCTTVPTASWLHVLVPWRDEQARYPALGEKKKEAYLRKDGVVRTSLSLSPRAWVGMALKHPRVYSKIARKAQWQRSLAPVAAGSRPTASSRWCGEQACGWTADVMPAVCLGSYAGAEQLVLVPAQTEQCYDADLGAIGNKLHRIPQGK